MNISMEAKEVLNDRTLIAHRNGWFTKLENVYSGGGETVFAVNGIVGRQGDPMLAYDDPEGWVVECLEDLASRISESDSGIMFKPACIEYPIYGVHFIDKILGADVFFQDDQWYNHYLSTPVGSLEYPDLEKSGTWQMAKRATLKFVEQGVHLPLFGLPTIASALNIAVNLYGQEILMEMLADTDNAVKDLRTINRLLCDLHNWYRSVLPMRQLQPVISWNRTQPPGYGQLCGCTNQLVSSAAYRELVAPLDEELLSVYPNGGMIHLCGSHAQHVGTFSQMPKLRAVQLNDRAAHDLGKYFTGLRDDQVIYLNPCEGMSVEKALAITGGRRLVIADTIASPFAADQKSSCPCGAHG